MRNYFILFLFQLWIARAFLLYNTFFPLYRTLNNHIQGNLIPKLNANNESKLIITTPGGLYGFYLLGISSYVNAIKIYQNMYFQVRRLERGILYFLRSKEMIQNL